MRAPVQDFEALAASSARRIANVAADPGLARVLLPLEGMKPLALAALLLAACSFDPSSPIDPGDSTPIPDDDSTPAGPSTPSDETPSNQAPDDVPPGSEPCQETAVSLLQNADFDAGNVDWAVSSSGTVITDSTRAPAAYSPNFLAWLGGRSFYRERISQSVLIPEHTTALHVTAHFRSNQPLIALSVATLDIELRDAADTKLETVATLDSDDIANDWQFRAYEVAGDYAGQTVTLALSIDTDVDPISVFVDSVELEAIVCRPVR